MKRLSSPASLAGAGALDEPAGARAGVHGRVCTSEGDADLHAVQLRAIMPAWRTPRPQNPLTGPRDLDALDARRRELRERYLVPEAERPASTGGGVHHLALICADPERTIRFYQDLLGFPLVELFENRDYEGSSHFFFDIGNRNLLAFFDFPGLGLEPVPEGLGGVQHVAISVTPEVFEAAKVRLADAGVEYRGPDLGVEESIYFKDPDNIQVELIRQPLVRDARERARRRVIVRAPRVNCARLVRGVRAARDHPRSCRRARARARRACAARPRRRAGATEESEPSSGSIHSSKRRSKRTGCLAAWCRGRTRGARSATARRPCDGRAAVVRSSRAERRRLVGDADRVEVGQLRRTVAQARDRPVGERQQRHRAHDEQCDRDRNAPRRTAAARR